MAKPTTAQKSGAQTGKTFKAALENKAMKPTKADTAKAGRVKAPPRGKC